MIKVCRYISHGKSQGIALCGDVEVREVKYVTMVGWYYKGDRFEYFSKGMIAKQHGVDKAECTSINRGRLPKRVPEYFPLLKKLYPKNGWTKERTSKKEPINYEI